MQETLLGRPTTDVITEIAQTEEYLPPLGFYLTSYSYFESYSLEEDEMRRDSSKLYPLDRSQIITRSWLDDAKKRLELEYEYTGVISRVLCEYGFKHIPMVDFDFRNRTSDDLDTVKRVLTDLCLPNGYIAHSGGGFHYIGARLMPEWGFAKALKNLRRLKKDSGVDKRWLAMSEEQGFFTLRLNNGPRKPQIPTIWAFHFLKGRSTEVGTPLGTSFTRYGAVVNQCSLFNQWELQQGNKTE